MKVIVKKNPFEKNMMKKFKHYDLKDALDLIGLERRRPLLGIILPAIGLVALGAAVGAAVGLAFAPSSGSRFRADMGGRLRERMKVNAHRNNVSVLESIPSEH